VRFFDFFWRRTGKTLQQQGAYVGVPYAVNDRFMRKDGVGCELAWPAQRKDQRDDDEGSHRKTPFGAFLSALSYLTMILARFLPSSEFVWAVANTKLILKITVKSFIMKTLYEKWPTMPSAGCAKSQQNAATDVTPQPADPYFSPLSRSNSSNLRSILLVNAGLFSFATH
jgi:hypothetical protein